MTPQITAADTVIMQVEIQNDIALFGQAVQGIPPISTQRARTTVQVANGETTVIGGIFAEESKLPGAGAASYPATRLAVQEQVGE